MYVFVSLYAWGSIYVYMYIYMSGLSIHVYMSVYVCQGWGGAFDVLLVVAAPAQCVDDTEIA